MNAWETLGIEPTTNLRDIKKAYAKQLKSIDIDLHPEQFIALREALDLAQYEAEYGFTENETEESETEDTQLSEGNEQVASLLDISAPNIVATQQQLDEQYNDLEQHIIKQDIHFNIRAALQNFLQDLESQPIEYKHDYILRINGLLQRHDLDDFTINTDHALPLPTTTEQLHADNREINTDLDQQQVVESNEEADNTLQELYELKQLLWDDNIDDDVFDKFQYILQHQFDLSLEQQIEIKDHLTMALAELRIEHKDDKYYRYLKLWHEIYPEDTCEYNENFYAVKLQERLQESLERDQWVNRLPDKDYQLLEKLLSEPKLHPLKMLHLQKQLGRSYPKHSILEVLDQLSAEHNKDNINYLFLKNINFMKSFVFMNCVLTVATYNILSMLYQQKISGRDLIFLAAIFFIVFTLVLQPIIQAKILAVPDQAKQILIFQRIWFVSAVAICFSTIVLPSYFHTIVSYLWLISTVILLGCLHLQQQTSIRQLFQSCYIKCDYYITFVGFLGICALLVALFYWFGQPNYPWLIIYSLIPVCCLLFPDSFRALFNFCSQTKFKYTKKQIIQRSLSLILIPTLILGLCNFFFHSALTQNYLYSICLIFIGLFFTLFNIQKMSAWIKYMTYAAVIVGSFSSIIIPLLMIFYLYKSIQAQKEFN